jgi:D-aminopeptidase
VGEATEEAVLNSMIMADTTQGADGITYYSLREFASYLIPAAL